TVRRSCPFVKPAFRFPWHSGPRKSAARQPTQTGGRDQLLLIADGSRSVRLGEARPSRASGSSDHRPSWVEGLMAYGEEEGSLVTGPVPDVPASIRRARRR